MGIRGLNTLLQSFEDKIPTTPISRGSCLLIDGDGWVFFLLKKCYAEENYEPCGNYNDLNEIVGREVNFLRNMCGFKLIVMFDGSLPKMKVLEKSSPSACLSPYNFSRNADAYCGEAKTGTGRESCEYAPVLH